MKDDLFIEMECAQVTKAGQAACGDDVRFLTIEKENRHIAALSDGLGSGVKANVLSTMTTTMALRFLESNLPTLESVEIIMDSLPVCEERKISYATFSLFDFALGGRAKIVEMGNPGHIHLRGTDEIPPASEKKVVSVHWPDRTVRECEAELRAGDRVILCSDGVTQAGLGESEDWKNGWRRSGVLKFAKERLAADPDVSAADLSRQIVAKSLAITRGVARDATSCVVVYLRRPRVMRVLTGPPVRRESDAEFARRAGLGEAHVVVCGGTTANIVERELSHLVASARRTDIPQDGGGLPPPGRIPGVALTTEGILTLSRVLTALEDRDTCSLSTANCALPTAAREILSRFMSHDRIEFVVGTKVNESHQNPDVPQDLELRRSVVGRLRRVLERKYRKKTTVDFY